MTKTEARKIFKLGNKKISSSIAIWSLPAGKVTKDYNGTCQMECKGCYAIKDQIGRFKKSINKSRENKLLLSKQNDFMFKAIEALTTLNILNVRIHEAGDFYSQEYINKWVYIASSLPNVTFTAYTKQMTRFDFTALKALKNVIIIDSLANGGLNYGEIEQKPLKAILCLCGVNGNKSIGCGIDKGCTICYDTKNKKALEANGIYFLKH